MHDDINVKLKIEIKMTSKSSETYQWLRSRLADVMGFGGTDEIAKYVKYDNRNLIGTLGTFQFILGLNISIPGVDIISIYLEHQLR